MRVFSNMHHSFMDCRCVRRIGIERVTGWLSRWLDEEDGVASSVVKRRGKTLKVHAETDVKDPEVMREQLTTRIAARVDSLGLEQPLKVEVRLR